MQIQFSKYHGTGNDFVIIDNRDGNIVLSKEQIHFICHRHFGIGADGLMLLGLKEGYDFKMTYFNADGAEGSMCGNGGRCLTQFAYDSGIHKNKFRFIATDGEHEAFFGDHQWIHLKMKNVYQITRHQNDAILNTGSPHYVKEVLNLDTLNVTEEGRRIRYSVQFEEKGINVNFVELKEKYIQVRTYERGVEDETYSCGTGVTATALVFAHNEKGFNRVEVETKGGQLAVEFEKMGESHFEDIWLCGPAQFVFKGTIDC